MIGWPMSMCLYDSVLLVLTKLIKLVLLLTKLTLEPTSTGSIGWSWSV